MSPYREGSELGLSPFVLYTALLAKSTGGAGAQPRLNVDLCHSGAIMMEAVPPYMEA
jgi:hypothetical protein